MRTVCYDAGWVLATAFSNKRIMVPVLKWPKLHVKPLRFFSDNWSRSSIHPSIHDPAVSMRLAHPRHQRWCLLPLHEYVPCQLVCFVQRMFKDPFACCMKNAIYRVLKMMDKQCTRKTTRIIHTSRQCTDVCTGWINNAFLTVPAGKLDYSWSIMAFPLSNTSENRATKDADP